MTTPSERPDLLGGPPPTLLADDPAPVAALAAGDDPRTVAARFPKASIGWAVLAENSAGEGRTVESYAFARTGYHRGLDALRRSGWRGHGPIPWSHEPNQGFLRALAALGRAAQSIDEKDEADRIRAFLADSDPEAARVLGFE
jgi:hypothetical protein